VLWLRPASALITSWFVLVVSVCSRTTATWFTCSTRPAQTQTWPSIRPTSSNVGRLSCRHSHTRSSECLARRMYEETSSADGDHRLRLPWQAVFANWFTWYHLCKCLILIGRQPTQSSGPNGQSWTRERTRPLAWFGTKTTRFSSIPLVESGSRTKTWI
jgi:hypothetical protein